ncbi:peroxisomal biogenesis factor 11 [Radiomyces spectabilis]|uniref:peroxisomal biogenesis factor 11 n=1 Tax=Radiomyces spectabilis TaxID=64574 RepID=UPI0022202D1C|nr:peroxisomal biogenesis factor 11 [Radiomyces spectabilis]KAI8379556.1 peroxisomal biogenesis factor 11 [Radiomyces spectabilis]
MTEKPKQTKETLNPLAIAKVLGPSTPTLDHLIRFLSSVRGTDKVLMFIQYWSKILIWFIQRKRSASIVKASAGAISLATRIKNFAGPVSDFRILLRYYGLLPMIQYMNYLEFHPPASKLALAIERIQNWCNVIYYPLEHTYWLGAHQIIPLSEEKTNKIGMWSCRFWAAYVVLEYGRLFEQYRDLRKREMSLLKRIKSGDIASNDDPEAEMASIKAERSSMIVNTLINSGYLPLTVHWSLEHSTFPDVLVGVCGGFASIFQIYAAWRATA